MFFLKLKKYTKKNSLPILFSKGFFYEDLLGKNVLYLSSNFYLKIFIQTFLKFLKNYKRENFFFGGSSESDNYSQKLQSNGFYSSFTEVKKKEKLIFLKGKISSLDSFLDLYSQNYVFSDLMLKKKTLKSLSKGFDKFERYFIDSSNNVQKRQVLVELLKARRFFSKIFTSRLFLFVAKGRKKYRNSFLYFFKKKRKIDSLLSLFTSASLQFKNVQNQRSKVLKKLAWKVRKQKKWLRVGSWNLFRRRQRLSQIFYIPKQFEINYKTFEATYLGFTDFKTTYTRIPFRLNLRKLLTFLS